MTENPSSPPPNTRPMRHRWVHIVFGFFAGSIFLVVFILALALPDQDQTEDREATAWVFTGVQTFILGTWFLLTKWLKRRADKRAAAMAALPE